MLLVILRQAANAVIRQELVRIKDTAQDARHLLFVDNRQAEALEFDILFQ